MEPRSKRDCAFASATASASVEWHRHRRTAEIDKLEDGLSGGPGSSFAHCAHALLDLTLGRGRVACNLRDHGVGRLLKRLAKAVVGVDRRAKHCRSCPANFDDIAHAFDVKIGQFVHGGDLIDRARLSVAQIVTKD